MIKYLELTPPEKSEFRQAKIVSIEISEGDRVEVGDTLFIVKSGESTINLPSTMAGNVTEIIAIENENISVMTPLLLLETEVAESTASQPIGDAENTDLTSSEGVPEEAPEAEQDPAETKKPKKKKRKKKPSKKKTKKAHQQQTLDLLGDEVPSQDPEDDDLELDEVDTENESATDQNSAAAPAETPPAKSANAEEETSSDETVSTVIQIKVPDIGGDDAKVVEIFVKAGDQIQEEDSIVTLESDKASMEVPSTHAGIVSSIAVEIDQDVNEGTVLLDLEVASNVTDEQADAPARDEAESPKADRPPPSKDEPIAAIVEVTIPDIGGDPAKVIEILVQVGQTVALEDPLITLESDKASMEVPSSTAGTIESIEVGMDQEVNEGTVIVKILSSGSAEKSSPVDEEPAAKPPVPAPEKPSTPVASTSAEVPQVAPAGKSHASPSVRRFARELGAQLHQIVGTGRKGRISKDDVKKFVKGILSGPQTQSVALANGGAGIPEVPAVDFSKFGEIDIQPLNRIKRLTAENLHRSWLNVPHVTHHDEANISELDTFRKELNAEYAEQDRKIKLSPLAFIVKAVVSALQNYPQFNSSLEPGGENLIFKKYINIGIAVETPNGLVVPVLKDADKMSLSEIAESMGELAAKARDKKLTMADMSGSCFTISSLGGIGGTKFSPIVNTPEVAILGVSRSKMQPVWNGEEFQPGMMLPLSLSYDHRVIDGAEAARFARHVATVLEDVRRLAI